jgi:hypothetical protein
MEKRGTAYKARFEYNRRNVNAREPLIKSDFLNIVHRLRPFGSTQIANLRFDADAVSIHLRFPW